MPKTEFRRERRIWWSIVSKLQKYPTKEEIQSGENIVYNTTFTTLFGCYARDLMALNPPGHRSKRPYIHRFLAGKQGKRFDDACVPPVTRTVVYRCYLFPDGIANECRLCAVQRLIAGMCRTPLATAPHASIKK